MEKKIQNFAQRIVDVFDGISISLIVFGLGDIFLIGLGMYFLKLMPATIAIAWTSVGGALLLAGVILKIRIPKIIEAADELKTDFLLARDGAIVDTVIQMQQQPQK